MRMIDVSMNALDTLTLPLTLLLGSLQPAFTTG